MWKKKIASKRITESRLPLSPLQTKRINLCTVQRLTRRPQHPTCENLLNKTIVILKTYVTRACSKNVVKMFKFTNKLKSFNIKTLRPTFINDFSSENPNRWNIIKSKKMWRISIEIVRSHKIKNIYLILKINHYPLEMQVMLDYQRQLLDHQYSYRLDMSSTQMRMKWMDLSPLFCLTFESN